jgi:nitrogen-specific signal transduction histidine kinase
MQNRSNNRIIFPLFYRLLKTIEPFFGKQLLVFVFIAAGLIWYTWYTRDIVGKLQHDAENVTQTYTELIRAAVSESMSNDQMSVVFEEVIKKTAIPIIITDTAWTPLMWKNIKRGSFFARKDVSLQDTSLATQQFLRQQITEFKKSYTPKPLYLENGSMRFGYLVFGNSDLVLRLSRIPLYECTVVAVFFLVLYLGFRSTRKTEQSNLWVALAREAAHQLGTPLSSLMGWIEVVKSSRETDADASPDVFIKQTDIVCEHMQKDIARLQKISNRFSKIGSQPELLPCDINAVIVGVSDYYQTRLPILGKHIDLTTALKDVPPVAANRELMEWVFENLIKNSVDAITQNNGHIEIRSEYNVSNNIVRIYHKDNGKGIAREHHSGIFSPGFSTKKKGWGIGLTLARRIVQDYHNGHIYLVWSQKNKGTEFCIELPVFNTHSKMHRRRPSV